ncbi:nose resistant to fluoxetine protein 6-like [Eupeodes corollae]|uniref:nose resistant to fluoxetine protein 6-like n=1 Tax=Eupeodes corollae TaxID=290404 RepID=UPI0024938800|nr:nose resistant to fluoxetine protein 6-like [Eupeodes corollae]
MNLQHLCLILIFPVVIECQFNMTAYRKMPPLYIIDDYDACLETENIATYCLAIGEIVPNATSALWQQIETFSSATRLHFQHNYLYFGVCLTDCQQTVSNLNSSLRKELYAGTIENTELVEYFSDINKIDAEVRFQNEETINICLNYDFEKQYDLQTRSFVEYCVTNEKYPNYNYLEIVFLGLIGTLLFLVIVSSNYDRQLKSKQVNFQGNTFYQQHLHTLQDTMLTSFSMFRNYYRLVVPSKSELARDLRFLETYRFFATLLVVFGHVLLSIKGVPLQNTQFIEQLFYKMETQLFINGTVIIQVFLVISSFLMCIHFQKSLASKKPGIAEWFHMILYRYLRLAPSLAFMILLNGSVLPRFQEGPFWRHTVGAENVLCQETWWRNLLFINNFTLRKSCLQQTWYLATDFQLYVVFAGLLIFMARFPKTKNYVLGFASIISFLCTGLVTYFLELDAAHQETPDSYRYLFWTNGETIYKGYAPFYMNFGGFVFGTITALIFLKYKDEGLDMKGKKSTLNRIVVISLPLPFLMLLSGQIFYSFEFIKPSVWIAIYAGMFRNVWAIWCCSLVLLMAFKIGSIFYRFCSLRIFAPLGRLSFQVFLIHTIIIRCIVGCIRQPIFINNLVLSMYIAASVVISFFFAFFLYTCFELPLATIINAAIKGFGAPSRPTNSSMAVTRNPAT